MKNIIFIMLFSISVSAQKSFIFPHQLAIAPAADYILGSFGNPTGKMSYSTAASYQPAINYWAKSGVNLSYTLGNVMVGNGVPAAIKLQVVAGAVGLDNNQYLKGRSTSAVYEDIIGVATSNYIEVGGTNSLLGINLNSGTGIPAMRLYKNQCSWIGASPAATSTNTLTVQSAAGLTLSKFILGANFLNNFTIGTATQNYLSVDNLNASSNSIKLGNVVDNCVTEVLFDEKTNREKQSFFVNNGYGTDHTSTKIYARENAAAWNQITNANTVIHIKLAATNTSVLQKIKVSLDGVIIDTHLNYRTLIEYGTLIVASPDPSSIVPGSIGITAYRAADGNLVLKLTSSTNFNNSCFRVSVFSTSKLNGIDSPAPAVLSIISNNLSTI